MQRQTMLFFFFLLVVFAAGAVLLARTSGILSKIGEALVVAAFIAAVVDQYVKHRLVSDVAKDIAPYFVGALHPKEVKDEIGSLLRVPLVRRDCELTYRLTRIENRPGFLRNTVHISYRIINLTTAPQPYEHYLAAEKCLFPEEGETQITGLGLDGGRKAYSLRPGDSGFHVEDSGTYLELRRKVTIPKAPHEDLVFWGEYSEVFKESDTDIFAFAAPTIGVTVSVQHPDDISVEVSSMKGGDVVAVPPDRPHTWSYRGVFLNGQHIRMRWRPRSTP